MMLLRLLVLCSLVCVLPASAKGQQIIDTVAGGNWPNGIPANLAGIGDTMSVALDASSNLYVASLHNGRGRIYKVDVTTGSLTTVAGGGSNFGNNIAATAAALATPMGIAFDSLGNLFIADYATYRIQRVDTATGIITTVAGTGIYGFNGDNILATNAQLARPTAVALDGYGNLFIAEEDSHRIRRVDAATGIITTVVGTGVPGFNGDNILATNAQLSGPSGVALDHMGNLYIADRLDNRIRKVDVLTGVITTVAGTGVSGFNGDNILATNAQLSFPTNVAVDDVGSFSIADQFNQRIRRVDALTGIITTVAGNGGNGFTGDNKVATNTALSNPNGVALNESGTLLIADSSNARVRVVFSNNPPVANNDSYNTNEDTAISALAPGVLGNDMDIDSPALTAALVSGTSNGALTFNSNGSFSYLPNANFFGTDSFTYKANDGFLDSNVATVTITVNAINDAPVAGNDSYSVDENTALNVSAPGVLGNDTDIDSSSLTAVLNTVPANGTLTLNPNGSFTYTPNANFFGSDSFTYRANDGFVDSNTATVTITVNLVDNTPPDTAITQAPPVLTNSTTATFAFTSTEPVGATFLCSLDNAAYSTCSSGIAYNSLAAGNHIFRVAAVDVAGNVDQSPAEHSWTIDTTAPNTTFTGTPPSLTSGTSARFDFTSTEAGSTFECSLDSAAFAPCTSPTILNGLASGAHTFDVRATDPAGNTDPSPASKTWTIDANPPTLTNFIVDTPAVDTTNGPANVVTTVTAIDDLSGVNTPTVNMTSPSGFLRSSTCTLTGGTLLNRTYQCRGVLPQYSESGAWQFSVQLKDVAGSSVTFTSAQILALGFANTFTNTSQPGINLPTLIRINDPALPSGVDGFNLTRDTTTGREWLDLTLTKGLSYNEIASGAGGYLAAGFQIATTDDVTVLFTNAGATNLTGTAVASQAGAAMSLISILGCTASCGGATSSAQGYMDFVPADPSQATVGSVQYSESSSVGRFTIGMAPTLKTSQDPTIGTFLYRRAIARRIYWSESDKLRRANVALQPGETPATRTDIENLLTGQPTCCGRAFVLDETNKKMYWSNTDSFTFGIRRANLNIPAGETAANRTDVEFLVPGQMLGLALDLGSGKMYWTQTFNGNVRRSNLDIPAGQTANTRTDIEDLVAGQSINRRHVALDKVAGKLYFVDGDGGRIQRANFDGSNFENLITGLGSYDSVALVLDLTNGKMYFTRGGFGGPTKIQRANLDGSGIEDIVLLSAPPYGLAIDVTGGKFYWATGAGNGNDKIQRANLQIPAGQTAATRTDVEDIVTGLNFVTGIALEFAPLDTAAPETTITSGPPALTNTTSATFSFEANEPNSTFACSLDSAAFTACSSPQTYNGLLDGAHKFRVQATDSSGNTDGSAASYDWAVDIVPPETTIVAGPSGTVFGTSATFDWTGSDDRTETGNLQYAYRLDPIEPSFSSFAPATSKAYTGLSAGNYTFYVKAVDEAGNQDTTPDSRSFTLVIQQTPAITWNNPADITYGTALSATQLNATAAVGGNPITGTFTYTPAAGTVLNAGNGRTLHVDFVPDDTVNYTNASKDVLINVLQATPTVSVTGGTFEFDGNPKSATGFAYGVGGVSDVLSPAVTFSYVGTGSTSYGPTATPPSARGTYSVTASFAGNSNYLTASNSAALTIQDTTGPVFTTLSTPPQYTNLTSVTFDFQTNEASTFACRLDSAVFTACASPQTYSGLADGLHTFEVQATDVSGNKSSASRSWTVDNVAPVVTITTPADAGSYLLGSAVAANYGCSDALSPIASCVGTVPNGNNFDTSSMGPKTFTVNASDQAGNTAGLSVTYNIIAPDLLEASLTNPPVSAYIGAQFDVTDKTQNLGNGPSGPSTTRYYLSLTQQQTNSGAILLGGSRSSPALTTAGNSNSFQGMTTVAILAGTPLGTYYLLACADDLAEVIESNEVNNCLASTGTVQIGLPDLIEANLPNPPSTITPGMVFSVTDRVQNSIVPAGPSTARYYLSTAPQKNGSEILLGARSVPALDANGQGSRSQATVDLTVPSGTHLGTYYLLGCADDLNEVAESNETNNCLAAANSTEVALPDLVQTSITNPPERQRSAQASR